MYPISLIIARHLEYFEDKGVELLILGFQRRTAFGIKRYASHLVIDKDSMNA